jgi:hypothetical protein
VLCWPDPPGGALHRGGGRFASGTSRPKLRPNTGADSVCRSGFVGAAQYIKTGVVKFPRHGCEQLLTQLLGFGAEKDSDAVGALVYLILCLAGDGIEEAKVHYI